MVKKFIVFSLSLQLLLACSSKELKINTAKDDEEFAKVVKIQASPENATEKSVLTPEEEARQKTTYKTTDKKSKKKKMAKKSHSKKDQEVVESTAHEPADIEGQSGFVKRRPLVDPFHVGEKLVLDVHYSYLLISATAGYMFLETKPFVEVNGRKSYSFEMGIKTYPFFSSFYEVDDKIDVLMDFENMVPSVFNMHLKETGQLKEAKSFFDWTANKAKYWERKVTKRDGEEEKHEEWDIEEYSQNLFSSIYYLRAFPWKEGAEHAFRVSDDKKNLIFKGKVVRSEKLQTKVGEFDTLVINAQAKLKDHFEPTGDILLWLSNDEHHYLLRVEAKIKIGSMVAEITSLEPGK